MRVIKKNYVRGNKKDRANGEDRQIRDFAPSFHKHRVLHEIKDQLKIFNITKVHVAPNHCP